MVKPLPPELLTLARLQSGALLGSQITDRVDDRRLRTLVRDGVVKRLWHNAYAIPELSDPQSGVRWPAMSMNSAEIDRIGVTTRLTAAELSLGRPVMACLDTAAEIYGFDITGDQGTHILAAQDWPSHREGLICHRPELLRQSQRVDGHHLTEITETALRIAARQHHAARSLAVLDAAVRHTSVTPAELLQLAGAMHIRGVRLLRELAPLADAGAQSPGESWLRWVCLDAGLPKPVTQIPVETLFGDYWIDLGWPERRVGLEYEGVEFHTGAALTKDRQRYNALTGAGWLMLGVTAHMVWNERDRLVGQMEQFLGLRGLPAPRHRGSRLEVSRQSA